MAIADGRDVDPQKDISTIDTGSPMRYGNYRDGYHWYYMSEQAEEDVLLFKTYDSDQSVPSITCLRTTFDIPNTTTETVS
jgi:DNA-binding transcriptional regulator YhcF (GntR family)